MGLPERCVAATKARRRAERATGRPASMQARILSVPAGMMPGTSFQRGHTKNARSFFPAMLVSCVWGTVRGPAGGEAPG